MPDQTNSRPELMRIILNLAGLGLGAGIVVLIVATIVSGA